MENHPEAGAEILCGPCTFCYFGVENYFPHSGQMCSSKAPSRVAATGVRGAWEWLQN